MALQRAAWPVAAEPRYAAPHVGPWLDAAAGELRGKLERRGAPLPEVLLGEPLPEVLLDGPSPVVVLLVGPRAHPRRHGRGLYPLGRTSRCSPR